MQFLDNIIEKERKVKNTGLKMTLDLKGTDTFSEIVQVIGEVINDKRIPKKCRDEYIVKLKDIYERTISKSLNE